MLHAFNQKSARRVLAEIAPDEHRNEKNEDAITSMVFSPLVFMPLASVLTVLQAVVGQPLKEALAGRKVLSAETSLWPGGLQASGWDGEADSRCEPDLMVRLTFSEGRPMVLLGEMKWDWNVSSDYLRDEINRQKSAVQSQDPGSDRFVFAITKFRIGASTGASKALDGVTLRTWVDVQRQALALGGASRGTPHGHWGSLVSTFLNKAKQASFQGFYEETIPEIRIEGPVFWEGPGIRDLSRFQFRGIPTHGANAPVFWSSINE